MISLSMVWVLCMGICTHGSYWPPCSGSQHNSTITGNARVHMRSTHAPPPEVHAQLYNNRKCPHVHASLSQKSPRAKRRKRRLLRMRSQVITRRLSAWQKIQARTERKRATAEERGGYSNHCHYNVMSTIHWGSEDTWCIAHWGGNYLMSSCWLESQLQF